MVKLAHKIKVRHYKGKIQPIENIPLESLAYYQLKKTKVTRSELSAGRNYRGVSSSQVLARKV